MVQACGPGWQRVDHRTVVIKPITKCCCLESDALHAGQLTYDMQARYRPNQNGDTYGIAVLIEANATLVRSLLLLLAQLHSQ